MKGADFQRIRSDTGKVLPVTSSRSSEVRQAATPTHTVSISDVTSKNINENWLTLGPATSMQFQRTGMVCRVGKYSQADLMRFCGGYDCGSESCDTRRDEFFKAETRRENICGCRRPA